MATARRVARSDDAKSRADEVTRVHARSPRPRVLAGLTPLEKT